MRVQLALLALLALCPAAWAGADLPAKLVDIPAGLRQQGDPAGEPNEARRDVETWASGARGMWRGRGVRRKTVKRAHAKENINVFQ